MSTKKNWKELRVGDWIRWQGTSVDDPWERIVEIRRSEAHNDPSLVGAVGTHLKNGIACREDTEFEVVSPVDAATVFGVVLEKFDDGSVRIDSNLYKRGRDGTV